jgi:hypothetical protein
VAALYPVGLLAVTLLLATDRPLRLGLSFYLGAATSLFVVGIVVITVLVGAGLDNSSSKSARGGFRLGLGTAMLIAAWVLSHPSARKRAQKKEPAWKTRLRQAHPAAVFAAGATLYSPSASYLGAVQNIATGSSEWPQWLQLLVVVAIVLITVEVPLLAYALRPTATAQALRRVEGWIDRNGRKALVATLVVVGGYLVVSGIGLLS